MVLLKNETRICGTGASMANTPLVQNKAYFQVNIKQTGILLVSRKLRARHQDLCHFLTLKLNYGI